MDNKEIVLAVVSKVTGVAKSTILSRSRVWPAVEARQLIILLLHYDGAVDEYIAATLRRGRPAIVRSRHTAFDSLRFSKLFREKYDKATAEYEYQKSLRVS